MHSGTAGVCTEHNTKRHNLKLGGQEHRVLGIMQCWGQLEAGQLKEDSQPHGMWAFQILQSNSLFLLGSKWKPRGMIFLIETEEQNSNSIIWGLVVTSVLLFPYGLSTFSKLQGTFEVCDFVFNSCFPQISFLFLFTFLLQGYVLKIPPHISFCSTWSSFI